MRTWPLTDEAFWMKPVGGIQNALSVFTDSRCKAIVDHGGSHHADSRVTMVVIAPGKEGLAKSTAVLNAAKAVWKRWPVYGTSYGAMLVSKLLLFPAIFS
jgi:hypothetical protein